MTEAVAMPADATTVPGGFRLEAGLAWTAWTRPLVNLVAWLLVGGCVLRVSVSSWARGLSAPYVPFTQTASFYLAAAGVVLMVLGLVLFAWRAAAIRSVRLYTDEQGIWRRSGVFPWTRNVQGVRWRDLEVATFTPGLGSWLSRSWSIRIGHRFTRTSEIVLDHVAGGRRVVEAINAMHSKWLAMNGPAAGGEARR